MCDTLKITDNAATMIMLSFIKACKEDLDEFCLSHSIAYRNPIANQLKVFETEVNNLWKTHQCTWLFIGMVSQSWTDLKKVMNSLRSNV